MTPAIGGSGGDLRWRSSLRLSPAPPIYGVMGDHGSPPEPPDASHCHVILGVTLILSLHLVLYLPLIVTWILGVTTY